MGFSQTCHLEGQQGSGRSLAGFLSPWQNNSRTLYVISSSVPLFFGFLLIDACLFSVSYLPYIQLERFPHQRNLLQCYMDQLLFISQTTHRLKIHIWLILSCGPLGWMVQCHQSGQGSKIYLGPSVLKLSSDPV